MRFLFCSLDSPGTLFPSVGMALELQRRGHEVAFVSAPSLGEELAGYGLQRIPRDSQADGASFLVRRWAEPVEIALQVKHVEHALKVFPADVLVGQQLTFGPLLVAERHKMPLAMIGYATYLWHHNYPGRMDEPADRRARLTWRYQDMLSHLNRARALFRLPALEAPCEQSPMLGDLFLLRSYPAVEKGWDDLPRQVHLVGACLWEPSLPADSDLDVWLDQARRSGQRILYSHHGQFFGDPTFLAALIRASEELGLWVAASVGRLNQPLPDLPERFFVRNHVSQNAVLPWAAAVVASGHSTVALGALLAGLPSLLVCSGGEQPDIGFRWQAADISRILKPEQVTPTSLREEIERVLSDPNLKASALDRQRDVMQHPCEDAVDLLEMLARERKPVLRPETVQVLRSAAYGYV